MGQRRLMSICLFLSAVPCGIFFIALCLTEYTISREGAINLHNCPAEVYIPFYLIVAVILTTSLVVIKRTNNLAQEKKDAGSHASHFPSSMHMVFYFMCWWCFIAGKYLLYIRVLPPNNCDYFYNRFLFWSMTVYVTICTVIGCIAFIANVVLPKICGPWVRDTCVTCCSCCECGRKLCERMSSTQSDDKNPSNSVPQSGADPYIC